MAGYFAQVQHDGLVTGVHRVDEARIAARPDLYPGVWQPVPDMTQYPAVGWTWDDVNGFRPPEPEGNPGWDAELRVWLMPEIEGNAP